MEILNRMVINLFYSSAEGVITYDLTQQNMGLLYSQIFTLLNHHTSAPVISYWLFKVKGWDISITRVIGSNQKQIHLEFLGHFSLDDSSNFLSMFNINIYDITVKKCLKVRQKLGTRKNLKIWKNEIFKILKFKFKIQNLKWLQLILGTCWTSFVFISMLKSRCL